MAIREVVAEAIRRLGPGETAKRLGLSTEATLRLAAGVKVQVGTLAQAELRAGQLQAGARSE